MGYWSEKLKNPEDLKNGDIRLKAKCFAKKGKFND